MQLPGRDRDSSSSNLADDSTEEGPALRDAISAGERAGADQTAADAARERFLTMPVPTIEADEAVASHLFPGEKVHDLRRRAILRTPGDDRALGYGGTLYLTSRKLVHLGQVIVTVQLTDILETSLAGERLLLTLRDGEGLTFDLDQPRLLRAEMAALTRERRA
jgi:hypothetical protein